MADVKRTLVSPDVSADRTLVKASGGEIVVLVPMAEWKQAAIRGIRSAIQFWVFLAGGAKVSEASAAILLPPGILPVFSTGSAYWDFVLLSATAGLFVFLWNLFEFWASLDETHPGLRV